MPDTAVVTGAGGGLAHRRIAQSAGERGRLRVWVNNAGVMPLGRAWAHSDADIASCVDTNVLGVIYGSRAAVEVMRPRAHGWAHVVNVASFAAPAATNIHTCM